MYEKQVEEKSKQLPEESLPKSYMAAIDNVDLEIFLAAEWIEASSIDEIREQQVQQCVEERCKRKTEGDQLYLIEEAVRSVAMDTHIVDAMDRVWTF